VACLYYLGIGTIFLRYSRPSRLFSTNHRSALVKFEVAAEALLGKASSLETLHNGLHDWQYHMPLFTPTYTSVTTIPRHFHSVACWACSTVGCALDAQCTWDSCSRLLYTVLPNRRSTFWCHPLISANVWSSTKDLHFRAQIPPFHSTKQSSRSTIPHNLLYGQLLLFPNTMEKKRCSD